MPPRLAASGSVNSSPQLGAHIHVYMCGNFAGKDVSTASARPRAVAVRLQVSTLPGHYRGNGHYRTLPGHYHPPFSITRESGGHNIAPAAPPAPSGSGGSKRKRRSSNLELDDADLEGQHVDVGQATYEVTNDPVWCLLLVCGTGPSAIPKTRAEVLGLVRETLR